MFINICITLFLIMFALNIYYLSSIFNILYTLTKNMKLIAEKYFKEANKSI